MLNVGEQAPEFSLPDQTGAMRTLGELCAAGELILYFYPADFTPVCTAEACAFRDNYDGVETLGLQVVGVSPQDEATHARFANQFRIPFPLLADPHKTAIRSYGVDGPLGFGVRRATFHIDQQGVVQNRVVADFFVHSHLELLRATVAGRQ